MIRINLLPQEFFKKEEAKQFGLLIVVVAGSLVILVVGFFFWRKATLNSLITQIAETQAELDKYQAEVARVEELERQKSTLAGKLNVIDGLVGNRLLYPKFMETFVGLIPDKVWITGLNTTSEGNKLKLNINAVSFDNYAIADFIINLQEAKVFSGVELGGITASGEGKDRTLSFTLTADYQGI